MVFLYPRLIIRKHTYYIRVQTPKHLLDVVKRKEIVYSLKTKNYFEALYRVREESYKIDQQFKKFEEYKKNMYIDKNKKIFLNEYEKNLILVERWVDILEGIALHERNIKLGIDGYKLLSLFQPDNVDAGDRQQIVDTYEEDGKQIDVYAKVVDIWDGYCFNKRNYTNNNIVYNPSSDRILGIFYNFVLSVMKKKTDEGEVDIEAVNIIAKNPNAFSMLFNPDYKDDNDERYNTLMNLLGKLRFTEQVLFEKVESIRKGTDYKYPEELEVIISIAKEKIKDRLKSVRFEQDDIDYEYWIKKWKEYRTLKKLADKTIKSHANMVAVVVELLNGKKLQKLTYEDIEELELKLMSKPTNSNKKYKDDLNSVIKRTKDDKKVEKLYDSTVRNYINMFSVFVNFLKKRRQIKHNPFDEYEFEYATAEAVPYRPFTDDDTVIFTSVKKIIS